MNQVKTTVQFSDGGHAVVRASEPRNQIGDGTLALGWMEWTAIFFIAMLVCMMVFLTVQGIAKKFGKTIGIGSDDGGEMEKFKQYKETWNRVAKDCIARGKDCDLIEKKMDGVKPQPKKQEVKKSKSDEKDPVLPDNQEWGEW